MKILEIDFLVMKLVYVNWYFMTETFSAVRNARLALLVTLTSGNINNDYNMVF